MKTRFSLLLCAAWLLSTSVNARADFITYGPAVDYKGTPGPSNIEIPIHTQGRIFRWRFKDTITIIIPTPSLSDLLGMFFITNDGDDPEGPVVVTTMYGRDLNPGGTELLMDGFDPLNPEVLFLSGETIIGNSGTEYFSSSNYGGIPVASLSGYFPEFDLSPLSGADPASLVYTFSTIVPGNDILVPEPSSALLAITVAAGLSLMKTCARRRSARS